MVMALKKATVLLAAAHMTVCLSGCSKKKEQRKKEATERTAGPKAGTGKTGTGRSGTGKGGTALNLVARADLDKIRKTPLWARLAAWSEFKKAQKHQVFARIRDRCKLDPFIDLARVSFSIPFGLGKRSARPPTRAMAAILEGRFRSAELMKCAGELLKEQKLKFKKEMFQGKPALRFATPRGDTLILVSLGENMLGAATVGVRNQLIGDASIFARAAKLEAGTVVGSDTAVWVGFMELPELVVRSFSHTPILGRITLSAAAVSADVTDEGYRVTLAFQLASQKEAERAARRATAMKDTLQQIKHKAPPRAAMMHAVMGKALFESKGSVLKIDLALSEDQVVRMFIAPFQGYLKKARD